MSGLTGWARPPEIQASANDSSAVSLYGSTGRPTPGGINQGSLGDCWFLSSASALAEYPERIERIFTNTEYSKEGIFEVNLSWKGTMVKEVVDDRIPVKEVPRGYVGQGSKNPFNGNQGNNGGWWLPILEKAYAKFNTNYANLNGGQPEQALRELSGMPAVQIRTDKMSSD